MAGSRLPGPIALDQRVRRFGSPATYTLGTGFARPLPTDMDADIPGAEESTILNETVNWMDLPDYVREAFQTKFGMPTKDLLQGGTVLYKFNDFRTLHGPANNILSPWWSPYHAYKQDAGWEEKAKIAKANGVSVREWGRLTSAVKENWNSLNFLLVITLKDPVYGFFGGFTQMQRIDSGAASKVGAGEGRGQSKNLPGGATQFYIPNLTAENVCAWKVEDLAGL